ncbi:MAG: hypothetical protein OJF52_001179 [Nitrospira sp.]|jgi:hypothetical protein|nr:MAG: hypothetical protein OJF52_001179 [Nitrospira sp.]
MYRYEPFDGLRQALRAREEAGLLMIPADMTRKRFLGFAETTLTVLLRRLERVLRQGGIPADIHLECSSPQPSVAAVFGEGLPHGVFFVPADLQSMCLTVRIGTPPIGEEHHRLLYRHCTPRFLERALEQAVQRVVLAPPI